MHRLLTLALSLLLLTPFAAAQFGNLFEQMFSGGHQQQHQQHQPQNVPSDSEWYQKTYQGAYCDKYLCPDTLACVHFPHHCPCAWPNTEDKVEVGEKLKICASKGGYKPGEMARKVELARKGLL